MTVYEVTVERLTDRLLSEVLSFDSVEEVNDYLRSDIAIDNQVTAYIVREVETKSKVIAEVRITSKMRR